MEDVGGKVIDRDSFLMIIVGRTVIDEKQLNWRENESFGQLTLSEISEQINSEDVIYVWYELGLSGKIYQYGNYEEVGWCEHGTTKGYA